MENAHPKESPATLARNAEKLWDLHAWLGLALYRAQQLEDELRKVCGLPDPPVVSWPNYENPARDSMGALIRMAKPVLDDDDLLDRLNEASKLRNYLVHQFFSSHLRSAPVKKKMQAMTNEAGMAALRFENLAFLLSQRSQATASEDG